MSRVLDFLKYFIPFSIVLFSAQFFVVKSLSENFIFFYATWSIYVFNILATFIVYILLIYVNKNFSTYTGFTFLGVSFFRMMSAVVFLVPFIKSNVTNPIVDVTAFFIPYFLFLLFEVYFTIKLINKV